MLAGGKHESKNGKSKKKENEERKGRPKGDRMQFFKKEGGFVSELVKILEHYTFFVT